MSDEYESPEAALAAIEKRRADRQAQADRDRTVQRITDMSALDALECDLGDSNVAYVDVAFTPGLPTLAAVKAPNRALIKRYQDRVKPRKDGRPGDPQGAAEELATACLVYPDKDLYQQMVDARPGLHVQLGLAAIKLAVGREEDQGKE